MSHGELYTTTKGFRTQPPAKIDFHNKRANGITYCRVTNVNREDQWLKHLTY